MAANFRQTDEAILVVGGACWSFTETLLLSPVSYWSFPQTLGVISNWNAQQEMGGICLKTFLSGRFANCSCYFYPHCAENFDRNSFRKEGTVGFIS